MGENERGQERRRHSRVQTNLRIQYIPIKKSEVPAVMGNIRYKEATLDKTAGGDPGIYQGTTHNLSESGLFLSSDKPFKNGEYLLLEMVLPDQRSIHVVAMVVRVTVQATPKADSMHQAGVQITAIHKEDLAAMEKFIRKRLKSRPLDA